MGKHRAISHSLQARTVIGGVLASGALLVVGAPAGVALAAPPPAPSPFHLHSPAVQARETAIKVKIVTAVKNSKLGQKVFADIAKRDPAALPKINAAITHWVSH